MNKEHYHPNKIKPLVQIIVAALKRHPEMIDNEGYLMAQLSRDIPGFNDPAKCLNCDASMAEYIFAFSILDAFLLQAMAESVREKMTQGVPFTEANRIHVSSLKNTTSTVIDRKTIASKQGLIAKYLVDKKQVRGTWVITTAGWAALRGEPVQEWCRVWRGSILERSETKISIPQIFAGYKSRNAMTGGRHLPTIERYNKNEWVNISGYHQGTVL
jgi:hypothetical protein